MCHPVPLICPAEMTATYRRSKVRRKAAKASKRRLPPRTGSEEATEAPPPERGPPSLESTFFTPTSPEPTPIYGLIEDWNRGVPPSNAQLLRFLDAWQTSPILAPDPRLSGAGLSLASDMRELGRVLAKVIRERNGDGLLQRFVSHLRLAGRILRRGQRSGRVVVAEDPNRHRRVRLFGRRDAQVRSATSGQRGAVKKDAQDLLSLGQLMISSTNFRQVIMEIQSLIKRALRIKPSAEESEHRKFTSTETTADMTTTGLMGNFQEMKRQLGQTEQEIHHLQQQTTQFSHQTPSQHQPQHSSQYSPPVMDIYPSTPRSSAATANQQEFATAYQRSPTVETPPPTTTTTATTTSTTVGATTTTTTTGGLPQTAPPTPTVQKSVRMDTLETRREPPETRPETIGHRDIPSSMPPSSEDETTQLLLDAKGAFKRLADNRNFRDAINGIYDILVRWQGQFTPGTILPPDLSYDANWYAARDDLLLLMERFASGVSVRPLLDSLAQVRREAARDYELMDFLRDWRAFLTACTSDPAYLEHHEYMTRGKYLLTRTSEYADRKYRRLFEENLKSWNAYMNGWQHDKLTTELGRILARIVQQDIFGQSSSGAEGRGTSEQVTSASGGGLLGFASVQASLLTDLQNVILPAVLRELYELPLPHMDMEAGSLRIALDNVVLPAALFAPAVLELRTSNRLRLSPRDRLNSLRSRAHPRDAQSRDWRSGAHLILAGMKGDINNVRFAVSRLAWPRLTDQGTADVRIGGSRGLSIIADVATDFDLLRKRFSLEPLYVRVRLSGLGLKFYGIRHETLFGIMRPYLQTVMKRRIERTLCERIVVSLEQFNRLANRLVKASLISSGH